MNRSSSFVLLVSFRVMALRRLRLWRALCLAPFALLALAPMSAKAAGGELAFSTDAVYAGLELPFTGVALNSTYNVSYQKNRGFAGAVGVLVSGSTIGSFVIQSGIGAKVYGINIEIPGSSRSGFFVGLAGYLRIPVAVGIPLSVEVQGHFSPEILSFMSKASMMYEVEGRVSYTVIPQADLFLGYGLGNVGFSDFTNHQSFQKSLHIGARLRF